ncbi:hypothetical protein [Microcoleus sp. herbarium5]|uniref:hypothetical protein n=1 Tax=Microcoleus sp. herbarium5 TaxID=3055434 RepID=UPI002FD0E2F8
MATTNSTKPISAPVSPPVRLADLTREEANTLTEQIKENFDSLGNMLMAARDRKAYKALGYRSFESYCQSEFGKSSSTAYQAIEDAKVRSQLEAHISENYGEEVTLKFPSSHLRSLKAVEGLDDKLKVIEYAQKLAEGEGKKPTKQHLEIAVFEISGKRSEDFRTAIQKLGFTKGVQVETISPIKKERGIITNLDKAGLIYVEHYYGSNKSVPYRPTELRILTNEEKPASPLEGSVASKGDRVLIYAQGLEGKKGTIYTWKEGKQTLVMVDGQNSPNSIAYAEMELLKETEQKNATWDSDLVWNSGKNTYYYFPQEKRITSNLWPLGLYLEPSPQDTASESPIKLMHQWERDVAGKVMDSLATPARAKTLALAQAIDLPEEEGKEFATDLIASLLQLFPDARPEPIAQKALGISFSKTIDELKSGKKTQTRRAWQDDYAKSFIRYFEEGIAIPALDKGRHRGGSELGFIKLTQRPYQQYLSEISPADLQEEGGMVATSQEFIDTFFEGQDKLVWVLHFEFLATPATKNTDEAITENQRLREQLAEAETAIQSMIETSTPSALASALEPVEATDFLLENPTETSTPGETAAHPESWKQLLEINGFTPVPYELEGMFKGHWRGWDLFFHTPNGGITAIDIANDKKEMFARCTEIDFYIDLGDEEALVKWTREIINEVEDFCPGQLAFDFDRDKNATPYDLPSEISERIVSERQKLLIRIDEYKDSKAQAPKKQIPNIEKQVEVLHNRLADLGKLEGLRIGQTVYHKNNPEKLGKITGFDFSTGGMPTIWLRYFQDGELKEHIDQELVSMIFRVDI